MTEEENGEAQEVRSNQRVVYLQNLKDKNPEELRIFAEESGIENAGMMLKQDIIFLILNILSGKFSYLDFLLFK